MQASLDIPNMKKWAEAGLGLVLPTQFSHLIGKAKT